MRIHAEDERQKKVIACHVTTGYICKNCINYSESIVFPDTGYCMFWNKPGLSKCDFCSLFKENINKVQG
jgi:hypothetical protein